MRIRDIGVIANYRYPHHSMKNHFDQQVVAPVDTMNLLRALLQIACNSLGKETPSILSAEEV
jgi:hypothetical protein